MQMCGYLHQFCYVTPLVYFVLFCFFLLIILFNYYFNAFLAFEKVRDRKYIYLGRRGEKVGGFLQELKKGNLHVEHLL